jgi:hypothetical protein
MPKLSPVLPAIPEGDAVPRLLHQHYLAGEAAIPDSIRGIRDSLRAANPGWTYSFWDAVRAENFISARYGADILARYRRIRPEYYAARSDLLRYLALYAEGGVYLDIKSTCDRPLDDAVRPGDRFLLMSWGVTGHAELAEVPDGEYLQWAIVTAPGHPFLREVILRVLNNIDDYSAWRSGVGRKGTLRLSGPVAYSLAIEPVRHLFPHTRLQHPAERGFVYTALPHIESHRDIFGRTAHYAALDTPVVTMKPGAAMMSRGVDVVRRSPVLGTAARRLRRLLLGRPT